MTPWCDLLSAVFCAGSLSAPTALPADDFLLLEPGRTAMAELSMASLLAPLPVVPLDAVSGSKAPDDASFAAPHHAVAIAPGDRDIGAAAAVRTIERLDSGAVVRKSGDDDVAIDLAVLLAVVLVVRRRLAWFNARHAGPRRFSPVIVPVRARPPSGPGET